MLLGVARPALHVLVPDTTSAFKAFVGEDESACGDLAAVEVKQACVQKWDLLEVLGHEENFILELTYIVAISHPEEAL